MCADNNQVHVSSFKQEKTAQMQPHPEFFIPAKRAKSQTRVKMWMANDFHRLPCALSDQFLFAGRQLF